MTKTPQEQTDEFLLAVGQALHAWAAVEEAIVLLFSEAIKAEPKRLGILVMSAIVSFEAKVKVTSEVMRYRLEGDPDLPVWDKLAARILKFYKKRHELAHFILVTNISETSQTVEFQPYGFYASMKPSAKIPLTIDQIRERVSKFHELRDAVHFFMWQKILASNWPQSGEPRWPTPDLIHRLRSLADQTHGESQPPPQPWRE